ncbi:hypothetical protein [Rhizobium hidalgonense]|nr:hypothetical protein [Rhizobium hidalgonense]
MAWLLCGAYNQKRADCKYPFLKKFRGSAEDVKRSANPASKKEFGDFGGR